MTPEDKDRDPDGQQSLKKAIIIFAVVPLADSLSLTGLLLLVAGGISYTVGGIIYGIKPDFLSSKYLGFHEIFHLFILFGSLCHFLSVYFYVL